MINEHHSVLRPPQTGYYPQGEVFSNKAVKGLYWTGRACIQPITYAIERIAKAFSLSMKEGVEGRASSRGVEILRRIAWVTAGVAILLTIIPLILAAIGFIFMSIGDRTRKAFVFIEPNEPPKLQNAANFSLTTFNLGFLPSWIAAINHLRPTEERTEQFIDYILNHQDADCLCLQELFDEKATHKVIDRLKAKYPYIVAGAGKRTLFMNSGLAILSKRPLSEPTFWGYKDLKGSDRLSTKGVLGVRVALSDSEEIVVLTTHMQSGRSKFPQKRAAQIKAIQSLYDSAFCQPSSSGKTLKGVLTCGDLNVGPYTGYRHRTTGQLQVNEEWTAYQEFFTQINHKFEFDLPQEQRGTAWRKHVPHNFWNLRTVEDWEAKHNEIDHILWLKRSPVPRATIRHDRRLGACSDHIPVAARFVFN